MKVRVEACYRCGKAFEFDTDGCMQELLQERKIRDYQVFLPTCPHCGTKNQVPVEMED